MKRIIILTIALFSVTFIVDAKTLGGDKKKSGMDAATSKVARGEHKQVKSWNKLNKKLQRQKKSIKKRIN